MHQGAQTCEELLAFYKERVQLEEEYSRRLNAISKKSRGTFETGLLRESFETLRNETEQMSRSHLNEARKLHSEALLKVDSFLSNFLARCKPLETSVENIKKTKNQLEIQVARLKEKYSNEVTKLNSYIAQESLLLGKELEKNQDRAYRQQRIVNELREEYLLAVQNLEHTQNIWIDEWKNSSTKLQDLEIERIQFLISNIWEYTNTVSTSCVTDDASCENIRSSLELCDPSKEISTFVKKFKTGSEIYSSPKFIDYLNGDRDEVGLPEVISAFDSRSTSASTQVPTPTTTTRLHSQKTGEQRYAPSNNGSQHSSTKLQRRPPPSDDGQTSISNPSSIGTQLHRKESEYSNPTSISSFTESIDNDLRLSKNWNSPSRRRSRNSEFNESWNRKNSNRRSFILDTTPKKVNQPYVIPSNQDPLRATLEDLKIGGNGDMNKFRQVLQNTNQQTSTPQQQQQQQQMNPIMRSEPRKSKPTFIDLTETPTAPDFNSSMSSERTNATTIRPKSMVIDSHPQLITEDPSMKRSSFHAGLRSQSKSTINLQSKVATNGLPLITRQGRRVIKHAKAIFDFKATINEELSFKEGDILLVVHMQDDGWWECERLEDGNTGLAPYNYLERV
ncbi:Septation protein [Wickerhamomyces ciferrii]|uniref:Septation protein n=1 Tax=Wickerhamomyces ciferrii (strain ATCC 14091 / BCRC 22168 / CBS 111 / JCM 3599 / NBRC 0793 / NRRL Y-1031 F-60-10) TaxID=1206466 RepID=K0KN44_WICCF|nr:Septation protein [Wickerhamomyces ciferrii]CCH44401.1 Septation protein [Wickerhamomyces ciferrii]